jgi:orotidine-5'-phosphate decarboxylase
MIRWPVSTGSDPSTTLSSKSEPSGSLFSFSSTHCASMNEPAYERIMFPLDVETVSEARTWTARLQGRVGVMKVGLELFVRVGPDAVRMVHDAGARCFLDLKLHDIPQTMLGAVRAAAELNAAFLTVHASAGPTALKLISEASGSMRLLAVTALTSLSDTELADMNLPGSEAYAVALAASAHRAGIRGFVCSPHEVASLRTRVGQESVLVVPGVRPHGSPKGDQQRVATPEEAIHAGADYLVIGRPIRDAVDPIAACDAIAAEITRGLLSRKPNS